LDFSNFRLYCQYPLLKIDFCWRDFINLGTARRPAAMEGVRSRIDQGFPRDYCFLTNEKENLPTGTILLSNLNIRQEVEDQNFLDFKSENGGLIIPDYSGFFS
jgi:hypothetical protein